MTSLAFAFGVLPLAIA